MSQHQVTVTYDFTSAEVFADRLDAMIDLLDARLPATTPPGTLGAPVDDAQQSGGPVEGGGENGPEIDAEPPVGTQLTETGGDGDVWERQRDGWRYWWGDCWSGCTAWDALTSGDYGTFRPTTDADRKRTRAPKPPLMAQDDEVIVKRADLTTALGVLEALNPFQDRAHEKWVARLDAALGRGQGA